MFCQLRELSYPGEVGKRASQSHSAPMSFRRNNDAVDTRREPSHQHRRFLSCVRFGINMVVW